MILNKVVLENFGLFAGKQEINLSPQRDKRIVLIGGKNGNGKTTLFEAIKLCLYGPRSLDKRFSKNEYEKYLIEKIHHNSHLAEQPDFASIGIELQHANVGQIDTYHLKRDWENNGNGFKEHFTVRRNGKELEEVDSAQWQDFINDLIPPGLSQLFFFDGEKIQTLAEDTNDHRQLADSFKSLLGVDLVEKLKSDLEIYTTKQLEKENAKGLQGTIGSLQNEQKAIESKLDLLRQEKAQLQTRIDTVGTDIERQEQIILREGGVFAEKRLSLKEEAKSLDAEIGLVEAQLRDFSADILPFVFAKDLSVRLKKNLIAEKIRHNENVVQQNIHRKVNEFKREIKRKEFWKGMPVDAGDISKITNKIVALLEAGYSPSKINQEPIHNLSETDHNKILSIIDRVMNEAPQKFADLCRHHEEVSRRRHRTERELGFAPAESILSKELKNNNSLYNQKGVLEEQLRSKEDEIRGLVFAQEKVERELRGLFDELHSKEDLSKRLRAVSQIQRVLRAYHAQLEQQKIKEFAEAFIQSYNQIARKKSVFEKIEVDPSDYSVVLYKIGGKTIPKSQLSAGEKQIYAIAVLWALTKISGRPIPFIIDTPLGRLDSDHRNKLVHNFFPQSSHQLIILSTDTEIDKEYLSHLRPYTVRTFKLEYQDGKTQIMDGYFGE